MKIEPEDFVNILKPGLTGNHNASYILIDDGIQAVYVTPDNCIIPFAELKQWGQSLKLNISTTTAANLLKWKDADLPAANDPNLINIISDLVIERYKFVDHIYTKTMYKYSHWTDKNNNTLKKFYCDSVTTPCLKHIVAHADLATAQMLHYENLTHKAFIYGYQSTFTIVSYYKKKPILTIWRNTAPRSRMYRVGRPSEIDGLCAKQTYQIDDNQTMTTNILLQNQIYSHEFGDLFNNYW